MAYCRTCGSQIDDNAVICPNCGTNQNVDPVSTPTPTPQPTDNGGFLWGILGCCIPIVGLVLFLVWKDTKPNSAKAAGIGALVSVGLAVLWYIFIAVIGVGMATAGF